jgi:hypothetical protein
MTILERDDSPKKASGHNGLIGTFDLYIQIAARLKLGVSGNGTSFFVASSFEQE